CVGDERAGHMSAAARSPQQNGAIYDARHDARGESGGNHTRHEQSMRGARLALLTFALSLATFIEVLDSTVTNVAVPAISGGLGVSNSQGTWVISSYSVAAAIAVPLTGWLSRRLG